MQQLKYAQENVTRQARETPNEESDKSGSFCKAASVRSGPGHDTRHRAGAPAELLAQLAVAAPAGRNPHPYFRDLRAARHARGLRRGAGLGAARTLRGARAPG